MGLLELREAPQDSKELCLALAPFEIIKPAQRLLEVPKFHPLLHAAGGVVGLGRKGRSDLRITRKDPLPGFGAVIKGGLGGGYSEVSAHLVDERGMSQGSPPNHEVFAAGLLLASEKVLATPDLAVGHNRNIQRASAAALVR